MRWAGTGPKFYKNGARKVLYKVEKIEKWLFRNRNLTKDSIETKEQECAKKLNVRSGRLSTASEERKSKMEDKMEEKEKLEGKKQNVQLSAGTMTDQGKADVSQNAVKQGIFTKDLIISSGDGKEDEKEHQEFLEGIIESYKPQGQMEYSLVEKTAADFWRLKRVLRFETGRIRKSLDMANYDYYNATGLSGKKTIKTDAELDKEIAEEKETIDWHISYIKALQEGVDRFDKPGGEDDEDLKSNFIDGIMNTLKEKMSHNENEKERYARAELAFGELRRKLKKAGHTDLAIARDFIEALEKGNRKFRKEIHELEQKKLKNKYAEEVNVKVNSLPAADCIEKIIKYEKAIQKSISQNIVNLKRLRSLR